MSNDYTRCPSCKGSKTKLGLGSIMKECDFCDGIGYVEKSLNKRNYTMNKSKVSDADLRKDNRDSKGNLKVNIRKDEAAIKVPHTHKVDPNNRNEQQVAEDIVNRNEPVTDDKNLHR